VRRRLAIVAALAAGVLTLPGAPVARATDRDAALRELLAQRERAVHDGDRAAFLATVDDAATPAFRTRQERIFDGLRSLPLASYRVELRTDEAADLSGGLAGSVAAAYHADSVVITDVDVRYRLRDIDERDVIDTFFYTFVRRGERWRIISDTDVEDLGLPSARNSWDYGPVALRPSAHFTIVYNPADERRARALLAIAEEAYARLAASFGRPVPSRIAIVLPHTLDELREMIQATFDVKNFVAFASAGVDRDPGWVMTAPRVFIQDTNLGSYGRPFQLETLHHELVHVASFSFTGPFDPAWVQEGEAEWMATGRGKPKRVAGSDGVLPDDYEFTVGGGDAIRRAYGESTSAIAYLVARRGAGAVTDLIATIGEPKVAAGTERYYTDQAVRRVYGADFAAFEHDWSARR
jgi:hypothetical protein